MPIPYVALAIEGGIMLGSYIYHRWQENKPPLPAAVRRSISLPLADEGIPIPLIYGTVQIREPVVAWAGHKRRDGDGVLGRNLIEDQVEPRNYFADVLFVLGIPFRSGVCNFRRIWYGDRAMPPCPDSEITPYAVSVSGDGIDLGTHSVFNLFNSVVQRGSGPEWRTGIVYSPGGSSGMVTYVGGELWFHDGRDSQTFDLVRNYIADTIVGDADSIPAYRGYLTVCLFNDATSGFDGSSSYPVGAPFRWLIGQSTDPTPYPMEVSSWPADPLDANHRTVGLEANPIDVIRDVLVGTFGKLGIDPALIDLPSFTAAAITCTAEGNGYSRVWNEGTGGDCINEIMKQIDGVMFEDPSSGKLKIRLIRNDYSIANLQTINPDNCSDIVDVDLGSWVNAVDRVVVTFPNRAKQYDTSDAVAMDHASTDGITDDEMRELSINYPGCATQTLANFLAARELGARGRTLARLRAVCDRSMAGLLPGDVVLLTWPKFQITRVPFRVASPVRGSVKNRNVSIDLIQDFYYSSDGAVTSPAGDAFPPGDVAPEA